MAPKNSCNAMTIKWHPVFLRIVKICPLLVLKLYARILKLQLVILKSLVIKGEEFVGSMIIYGYL